MSYQTKRDYFGPSVADVERQRRTMLWMLPLILMNQGVGIFAADASVIRQVTGTIAWVSVTAALLWFLLGIRLRWMSPQEHRQLNDEWYQAVIGDSARWAFAAVVVTGMILFVTRHWFPLEGARGVFVTTNAAILTAALRQAWLNRGPLDEDD
ncbi:hypothetical protein GGQ97_000335 [Sphingomonas kaistensis]|uniref:Uncharacterized protein n=1 Tax=Sphingomonas kaistensis TaxID=298708 RepID=A0A7X5Y3M0_9SPHN|nr:hypothetical protein [Sphingomonas kaistensis]NJC04542.1 hypothetical protein [Sphingomonas kaistensis]